MPRLFGHKHLLQSILEELEPVSPFVPMFPQPSSSSPSTITNQLTPHTNSTAAREEALKQLLSDFDSDKDGKLTPYELKLVSESFAIPFMEDLFKMVDKDGSGSLDITEVKSLFSMLGLSSEDEELRKIFEHLDVNNDGTLDDTEFFGLVKYLMRRE
ncbi:unnamed protein product [Dibothriocephalus latus]|uniref:EF-hand domain-containing protein n=1 Tax=Dibothriocephalus latus TaxID=60516 RepID=A0A3P6SZN5_DIBLA|nr:unnamed protein product [Dibothriocephalus latus]